MATQAWAKIEFKAQDGKIYEAGAPLELPDETDEQRAEISKLRDRGIITTARSEGERLAHKAADDQPQPAQRTKRAKD